MRLSDLTTLRIGGEIDEVIDARTPEEIIDAVRTADEAGQPLLVLGGGSNLVASDAPFRGTVVRTLPPAEPAQVRPIIITTEDRGDIDGLVITHAAGTVWDDAVRHAIEHGASGTEALSGIPGSVGATPIQNVGAYGQDVSATIAEVEVWDRHDCARRVLTPAELAFGYRMSVLKATPYTGGTPSATNRWVVLSVTFHQEKSDLSAPIRYPELAGRLGVEVGERAPSAEVREAVLQIRGSKGMVLDEADHDTWSAGSFFTNPILTAEQAAALPDGAPQFPAGDGRIKSSAAWLISHAGIDRGFTLQADGEVRASVSTKHSLALTNRGGASSEDIRLLAREVQRRVQDHFGIALEPEPVRLGLDL
ncbi:UDP-N-acetylmuramate dehydrogenase [Helcobacillus massiliensis]|uniref:UDP-N-acetylmuramate dehydrogenase n=1 Tax=Helcobacillus massiliensis TaxID=521392 RepID=UPI0021A3453B|nr:UDP-N-acetylmuramate dehydrogenase [Helcobacillus massiliensis]MCT1557526.1 UDP-N-acetylmuramate dehydrogenase [Helcobacillus massiliensis]MCT2037407.1 UDP-N-acetylmuramate dehydrogenase [Helcobacillus massiliensis]MCT2331965.1 UDP-N-acetylmuramate dehydrogenase [Helcobacillus massiliensis]